MLVAGLLVASYVIGSIPFSFLIVKLMTGADVRESGSGNIGVTSVGTIAESGSLSTTGTLTTSSVGG